MENKDKSELYLFDFDMTICDNSHRSPYDDTLAHLDKPIMKTVSELESLIEEGKTVGILTGRKASKFRLITAQWIFKHVYVGSNPYPFLWMQEGNTAIENHEFKKAKLKELMEKFEIVSMVDDSYKVREVCEELGIPHKYP